MDLTHEFSIIGCVTRVDVDFRSADEPLKTVHIDTFRGVQHNSVITCFPVPPELDVQAGQNIRLVVRLTKQNRLRQQCEEMPKPKHKCSICGKDLPDKLPTFPKLYGMSEDQKERMLSQWVHGSVCQAT